MKNDTEKQIMEKIKTLSEKVDRLSALIQPSDKPSDKPHREQGDSIVGKNYNTDQSCMDQPGAFISRPDHDDGNDVPGSGLLIG